MAWTNGSSRTSQNTWKRLRQKAKEELEFTCQNKKDAENCSGPLELDHIQNFKRGGADEINNLQWLCHYHHMRKTQREAAQARRERFDRGKYPQQVHPGLL